MSAKRSSVTSTEPPAEPEPTEPSEEQQQELSAQETELLELHRLRQEIVAQQYLIFPETIPTQIQSPDQPTQPNREVWLWQKLAALIERLPAVDKDGRFVDKKGTERYRFVSQAQVMEVLGKRMAAIGLVTVPEITEHHIHGEDDDDQVHVTLKMREWLVDVDTGQRIPFEWLGEAADWGDKATQKAGTVGDKYWLMKLTKLTDFRDPDAENPTEEAQDHPRRPRAGSQPSSANAPSGARAEELADLERLGATVGLLPNGERKQGVATWYPIKVKARVKYYAATAAQFEEMSDPEWAQGVRKMREELVGEHQKWCGESCAHLVAPVAEPETPGADQRALTGDGDAADRRETKS